VAASLFAQRGYAATSMRDIALGVKMLPGSVYYHFASKEELLVAVYEAGVGELDGAVPQPSSRAPNPGCGSKPPAWRTCRPCSRAATTRRC
jgi:AcrR family transcriptional regulator